MKPPDPPMAIGITFPRKGVAVVTPAGSKVSRIVRPKPPRPKPKAR